MKLIWGAATLAAMAGVILIGLVITPLVAISDGLDTWRLRGGPGAIEGRLSNLIGPVEAAAAPKKEP
jgi:hypothetical protein